MEIIKGLNYIKQFLDQPLATYTHSGNKEVVVSAVDVDTDTFTSNGHGLSNGNIVTFVPNATIDLTYPVYFLPGGIIGTTYFIVGVTENTFQISTSNGGAALNLTANANLDVSKWHTEVVPEHLTISGLPTLQKCRLVIQGRHSSPSNFIVVEGVINAANWIKSGSTKYGYCAFGASGHIWGNTEVEIDYTSLLTMRAKGVMASYYNSATENLMPVINFTAVNPVYSNGTFTTVTLLQWYPINGFKVEVYRK